MSVFLFARQFKAKQQILRIYEVVVRHRMIPQSSRFHLWDESAGKNVFIWIWTPKLRWFTSNHVFNIFLWFDMSCNTIDGHIYCWRSFFQPQISLKRFWTDSCQKLMKPFCLKSDFSHGFQWWTHVPPSLCDHHVSIFSWWGVKQHQDQGGNVSKTSHFKDSRDIQGHSLIRMPLIV